MGSGRGPWRRLGNPSDTGDMTGVINRGEGGGDECGLDLADAAGDESDDDDFVDLEPDELRNDVAFEDDALPDLDVDWTVGDISCGRGDFGLVR